MPVFAITYTMPSGATTGELSIVTPKPGSSSTSAVTKSLSAEVTFKVTPCRVQPQRKQVHPYAVWRGDEKFAKVSCCSKLLRHAIASAAVRIQQQRHLPLLDGLVAIAEALRLPKCKN